ncbi:vacuolar membrane protein-domain-containing protein [Pseudoneurospora amorphoporcata]|uniref:Vacuolar membrane protein-domain-containing protein n=1 Tax=Pseudoneurospora amorphoporcata TaxID=241081 RepID=A0AAN6NZZ4_9PEZI|nr:vacuolar membrane protein-domain-containing protein [Pseudoneurospora amorphoporcata]
MFPLQQPPPPGPLAPGPRPLGATTHLSFSRQHRNLDIGLVDAPVAATLPSHHRVRIGTVSGLRRRLGGEAAAAGADTRPDYFVDPRVDTELHDDTDAEDTLEPQPFETFPHIVDVNPPAPAGTVISVTITPTSQPTSTPQPTSPTSASPMSQQTDNNTECRLLGSFAILVQIALGCLAISSLVYKRWRERPQRPVKIWFFDVSKQVFGSVLVHAANVFMSMLTSGKFEIKVLDPVAVAVGTKMVKRAVEYGVLSARGEDEYTPNPCSFYLLNLAIDTTIGIPILILLVRLLSRGLTYTPLGQPPESLQSGNYTPLYSPPGTKPRWAWWFKQSIIYFIGLMGMKFFVLIIFMVFPWISRVGDWALGWTEGNERLQIAFVMMIFPLIMNALQYYIIDSYIKNQEQIPEDGAESEGLVTGRGDAEAANPAERGSVYSVISGRDEGSSSEDDSDGEGELPMDKQGDKGGKASGKKGVKTKVRETNGDGEEYDPAVDGDTPTVIGSRASAVSGVSGSIREERLKESDSLISHE